jgi:MFS family permease
VASAIGPFFGGWLIDAASWRLVFFINVPLAGLAAWIALQHVPETRDPDPGRLDVPGALLITLGIAGVTYAIIERATRLSPPAAVLGVACLAAFVLVERASSHPMLPLELFQSRQFTGANLTTLAVYAGLGGALFLLVLRLQMSLGYSALEAGASLVPFTVVMLFLSPPAGQLAQRTGPRLPMTLGPLVAAAGLLLFGGIGPGDHYAAAVLPGVLVFAFGMSLTVAPLTATVLASVEARHAGVASGVNNAVARLAGLLAVAVLPALSGIGGGSLSSAGPTLDRGFGTAMRISAGLCVAGAVASFLLVRDSTPVGPAIQADTFHPCQDGSLVGPGAEARREAV